MTEATGRQFLLLSILALIAFCQTDRLLPPASARIMNQIIWEPCPSRGQPSNKRCGKYEVFEDRATRKGRKISLNIVVVPAENEHPLPDPVFFFAGGPGQGASSSASSLGKIATDRDIVFIDQRGTGRSNPLSCPEFDDYKDLKSFFGELYPPALMRRCRETLEQVANLSLYTTSIAVDDIDEVRAALGYDKINLYGVSYGTQAAQVYLRAHGDHVRAVLLEGVAPPNTKFPLQFARGSQTALEALFADCFQDPACHKAFANPKKEFTSVLARFDKGPITFEMTNTFTDTRESVTMSRDVFVVRLLSLLYSPASAAHVLLLLHQAFENNYEPFANAAVRANLGGGVARGVYFSITCSESIPFITDQDIVDQTKGTFLGGYRTRSHVGACREWPRAAVSRDFLGTVKSDRPVLMISGLIDPATPYWLGQSAIKDLPNARQLLIKNTGHSFGHQCLQNIAEEFIEKGSARELNTKCIDQISRPPFVTN